jgi:CBS domain-containing protein
MSESSVPLPGTNLVPHLRRATVADAIHPGILSCDADATLTEVARMMSAQHVHCIVVAGTAEREDDESPVWGIISDLDLLRAGMRPDAADTAAELAKQALVKVETTAGLRDTAEQMLAKGIRHVVAVDPDTQRPVGILSTLDIASVLARGKI